MTQNSDDNSRKHPYIDFENTRRFLLFFILFGSLFDIVLAQQQTPDLLNFELKDEDKASLTKKISEFSEKIRKQQWNEVYDLFLRDPVEDRTKEEFIQEMLEEAKNPSSRHVLGFVPTNFLLLNDRNKYEKVHVIGCLKLKINRQKHRYWGSLTAERNGSEDWLFTSLITINPDSSGGGPKPCADSSR